MNTRYISLPFTGGRRSRPSGASVGSAELLVNLVPPLSGEALVKVAAKFMRQLLWVKANKAAQCSGELVRMNVRGGRIWMAKEDARCGGIGQVIKHIVGDGHATFVGKARCKGTAVA